MDEKRIKNVACGILYAHRFSLLDKWGEIADRLLYNNEYFSSNYFPRISSQYTSVRSLMNEDGSHLFQLTSSNIVYSHKIDGIFDEEFKEFEQRIIKFIIPKVVEDNNLEVQRIGIVYNCDINENEYKDLINKYFKDEIKNINNFRFSRKEKTFSGANISGCNDFINKIYNLSKVNDNSTIVSFDYQKHFNPYRKDVQNVIKDLISDSKKELETDIF